MARRTSSSPDPNGSERPDVAQPSEPDIAADTVSDESGFTPEDLAAESEFISPDSYSPFQTADEG
jgi:hypothetical protein